MQQKAKHIIIFAKYSSIQFPLKIIYSSFELQLIYLKIIDLNISNVDYWKFEFEFHYFLNHGLHLILSRMFIFIFICKV